jgi:hypothetical protein
MRKRIEELPKPRMSWETVEITPRSGTTTSPVYLCYRDPVDAIRSLLDRAELAEHMTYAPQRHWKDKEAGRRRYSEIFTGDWAWETQVSYFPLLLANTDWLVGDASGGGYSNPSNIRL